MSKIGSNNHNEFALDLKWLIETFPFGVARVHVDQKGEVIVSEANATFFRLIGYTEEEFRRECEGELNHLSVDPTEFAEQMRTKQVNLNFQWRYHRRNGRTGISQCTLSPSEGETGERLLILHNVEAMIAAEWDQQRNTYFQEILGRFNSGGILIRRADTLVPLQISPNIPLILGYSAEEFEALLSSGYRNLLHPEDGARISAGGKKLQLPVPEYAIEYRVRKKDGTYLWVYDNTKLDHYYDGTPIYFSILLDATKRKENEIRLRASEEEYRLAVEQSGKMLYRYNLSARRLDMTDQTAELLGVPAVMENVPESTIMLGCLAPESVEPYRTLFAEMAEGNPKGQAVIRRLISDGSYRWFLERYTMVYTTDGTAVSAVGTCEDISEQYEKENMLDQLRRERELLTVVALHSGRSVFKYDLNKRMAYLDRETAERYGVTQELYIPDEHHLRLSQVAKESQEEYLAFYRQIARGEPAGSTLVRRMDISGKYAWYQADFTTITDDSDRPSYAVISFADVSDRYEMELSYRQYQRDYEVMNAESYTYYAFNLTRDRCDQERGSLMEHIRDKSDGTLEGIIQCMVERFISPESEAEYRKFNSRFRLLQEYADGKREESLEMLTNLNGHEVWIQEKICMFEDPYSGDVRGVFSITNIDNEKRHLLSLYQRAEHDSLTGLLNRSAFCEQVDRINEDESACNALLMLDLDNFKEVNDTYGHVQGDKVLAELGKIISTTLRSHDLLARLGGDEFLIYLVRIPNAALAMRRAESICKAIYNCFASRMGLSASIGVALFPENGQTFHELYACADRALYEAKGRGGNCYVHIDQNDTEEMALPPSAVESVDAQRVFVRTFGYFDLFIDEEPFSFTSSKAKELLAILVDRRGGILTSSEAVSLLWEDEPLNQTTLSRYRKVALRLKQNLDRAGIGDMLLSRNDGRCIDPSKFICDYYLYLDGAKSGRGLFRGSYMNNYSWGAETLANLEAARNGE